MKFLKHFFEKDNSKKKSPSKEDDGRYSKEIGETATYWSDYASKVKKQRKKLLDTSIR